jgi:cyanophycinase
MHGKLCRLTPALALVAVLSVGRVCFSAELIAADNILKLPAGAVKNHGRLIIVGGGRTPQEVKDEFLRLAGGHRARIALLPSAYDYGDSDTARRRYDGWLGRGESLDVIDTDSLTVAESKRFEKIIDGATGVWIGGGSQNRLMALYGRTRVAKALHRLLERGGVIGGTSAGAAVMSSVMIRYGRTDTPSIGTGFGLLAGAVVDQHFTQRKRETRLLGVLKQRADLIGLGVDERTALIVEGNRLRVVGDNVVSIYPAGNGARTPLRLKGGDQADLVVAGSAVELRVSPRATR